MTRQSVAIVVSLLVAAPALAERPRTGFVPDNVPSGELTPTGLVPYNTLFLNRCANGCLIRVGTSNSTTDSWPISAQATLTKFPFDDATWGKVVACVKDVFSIYNVNVTEVDPGTAKHFEIMIAGSPTDIGMPSNYGGVAPGGCTSTYMDNALVFDFAKVWSGGLAECNDYCVEEICATAAQEIGHTWKAMDHVIVAADPMTYFPYTDRRYFQNVAAQCGSDCVAGKAPNGATCTGTDLQNHNCKCLTGVPTQNSHQIVTDLFGSLPGTPPTVTFLTPKDGSTVAAGFTVTVDATDDSNRVPKLELRVNGQLAGMVTAKPYLFTVSTPLSSGLHTLEVTAYDPHGTAGKASVQVEVSPPCESASDCLRATDVCVADKCVPGPSVTGGLGTTCAQPTDCLSNQCALDDSGGYCVEQCTEAGQCPENFGCLDVGNGQSVCWPGYDDGGCGCQTGGRGGPLSLLALFMVVVFTWRRRR